MNGRITIELGGVNTPLTFGMMAIEELGKRQAIGAPGWAKLIVDLVYCGYCNDQILEGNSPVLSYRDIAESVSELMSNKHEVVAAIYKCFEDSKAGGELIAQVKKKLAEENGTPEEIQEPALTLQKK